MHDQPSTLPVAVGDIVAGKYRIERVIGVGGMGIVAAATQLQLDRLVALKFLLPEIAARADLRERFAREAKAAARIRGEHVARVLDVELLSDGSAFMVMEYLEGETLEQRLEREGTLSIPFAVQCVLETCEALAEAHAAGIVHRDLKPSNLFLARRPDGSALVKLLDFGISKLLASFGSVGTALTGARQAVGSPRYMSPEQLRGSPDVDGRSDVWAVGVILHQLLTGEQPFQGESFAELCSQVLGRPPPRLREGRPTAPAGLEAVIISCLERDPARRPDVAAVAAALVPFGGPESSRMGRRAGRLLHGKDPSLDETAVGVSSAHAPAATAGGELLLVVVDDPAAHAAMFEALARAGYRCRHAGERAAVDSAFSEAPPAAVLLDVQLRADSALSVYDDLRAQPGGRRRPVIALSYEHLDLDLQRELSRAGLSQVVHRPVDAARLIACVDVALGHRAARALRREPRRPSEGTIWLRQPGAREFVAAEIGDVSTEGLFVRTAAPPPAGVRVQVKLPLADGETLETSAQVVHTVTAETAAARGCSPGAGLLLVALAPAQRVVWERFVSAARPELERAPSASSGSTPGRTQPSAEHEEQVAQMLGAQLAWLVPRRDHERLGIDAFAHPLTVRHAYDSLAPRYQAERFSSFSQAAVHDAAREICRLLRESAERLVTAAPTDLPRRQHAPGDPGQLPRRQSPTDDSAQLPRRQATSQDPAQPRRQFPSSDPAQPPRRQATSGAPAQLPRRQFAAGDPAQLPRRQFTTGDPAQLPRRQVPTGDPAQLPRRQFTTGDPAQLPRRQVPSGDPAQLPRRQSASHDPAPLPRRQVSTGDPAQLPRRQAPTGDPEFQPLLDPALAAEASQFHQRAQVALDEGRHRDARNLCQRAVKLHALREYESTLELALATLAVDAGHHETARAHVARAARLDRRSERVAAVLSAIEQGAGRWRIFGR